MLCPRHLHPGLTLLPDCRMLTTAQDGLYFTTVSMSTVGYGDLVASTPLSRAFTGTWIIVGLLFIFAEFVAMFNTAIATLTKVTHSVIHWVLNVKPSESINPNVLKPNESQDVGSLLVFYFKGTWVALLWFFASQVLISLLISYADPQMKYDDILWYLFITASTVGYGDVNIRSQIGRLLAVAHVMISVMWLAALFAHVRGLNTARQRQVARVEMLRRQLDAEMIAGMDRDGNGVDIIEFIVETLMHLGTEVGGEKLDWKHIRPIIAQFRAFDVDHDGRLTHKDLAQLARLRASLMGDGSATDHIIKAAAKTQLDEESTGASGWSRREALEEDPLRVQGVGAARHARAPAGRRHPREQAMGRWYKLRRSHKERPAVGPRTDVRGPTDPATRGCTSMDCHMGEGASRMLMAPAGRGHG